MKRAFLLAMLLSLAACDTRPPPLRQVTIETPASSGMALGLTLQELPANTLRAAGLNYGLSVTQAGQLAQRAGLRVGDVVYAVNERRLRTLEDFMHIVAERPGESLGLQVRRGNADLYVPVDLGAGPGPRPARGTLLRT
jgi:S1-C subfamily serine protease